MCEKRLKDATEKIAIGWGATEEIKGEQQYRKRGTTLGGRIVKANEAQERFKGRQERSFEKCSKIWYILLVIQ